MQFSTASKHQNSSLRDDLYRLYVALLGITDTHTRNYNGIYVRDHIGQNFDPLSSFRQDFVPANDWAKALIVLSHWKLGEINANQKEIGSTFFLRQDRLSNHVWYF